MEFGYNEYVPKQYKYFYEIEIYYTIGICGLILIGYFQMVLGNNLFFEFINSYTNQKN